MVRSSLRRLRERIFGMPDEEASFARRRFRTCDERVRQRLEQVGRTFLQGYRTALEEDRPIHLARRLDELEPEPRGFAFEGAGMALYLLDLIMPWNGGRLAGFLAGPGAAHTYMVTVGAGWALAQLRRRVDRSLVRLDPLLGWLAVDGYGFHRGYFGGTAGVERHEVPGRLSGYARRVFDQGLGRSLWFVDGAEASQIAATIAGFDRRRHADLWSGVGLACAYAGGVPEEGIRGLSMTAGPYRAHLAQGAAFAAKARQRAGNPAPHTELACRILCGMPADEAAGLTDRALADLAAEGDVPAYEVWRGRIRANWTREAVSS